MLLSNLLLLVSLAAAAHAQSPSHLWPPVQSPLAATFGSTHVFSGMHLPQSETTTQPTIFATIPDDTAYMLLLLDVSVSTTALPPSQQSNLAPGLGRNRTTRLLWWQANIKPSHALIPSALTFPDPATPFAAYAPPSPARGDNPHTYVAYLFRQPGDFVPPSPLLRQAWRDPMARARSNFSLAALIEDVGMPVGATWFSVENERNPGASRRAGYLVVQSGGRARRD